MLLPYLIAWLAAATTPPWRTHSECTITAADGQAVAVRLIEQDELLPLDGKRWWIEAFGKYERLDTPGFESNNGPLYLSPDHRQAVAFQTFRGVVDGGTQIDLITHQFGDAPGDEEELTAKGWTRCRWRNVDGPP